MRARQEHFIEVLEREMRREESRSGEVKPPVGNRREQHGKSTGHPCGLEPPAGAILRKVKLPETIQEHRGIPFGHVELPRVDLG